jgi:alkylation response protein AidB-like acyl-CoA dehydrogenase
MDFALSPEQDMLTENLRGVLKQALPLEQIKAIAAGDAAAANTVSQRLDEFGLSGLTVPETHGGLGLQRLDACLVQEALGYACAPDRFMTSVIAADALRAAGRALIADLAAGKLRVATGLTERFSRRDAAGFAVSERGVTGTARGVLWTEAATHVLIALPSGALEMHVCRDMVRMQTIDAVRQFASVSLADSKAAAALADARGTLALAHLLVAADTLGAAQAMLDQAVAYAGQRQQFGRLIGSFQAVKHMCAEMAARIEPARALVWHAAHALDSGDPEGLVMAHLAKAHLADVGTFVARTATEVHGGMGFTDLLGLHYWFKRIGVNRQIFGSPDQAREMAAQLQGWAA